MVAIKRINSLDILKAPTNKIYKIDDKEKGAEDIKFKTLAYMVEDNGNIISRIHGWRVFLKYILTSYLLINLLEIKELEKN